MAAENKLLAWSQKIVSSSWTIGCFLFLGIIVRIIQYAANRSLWLDEAMLSKNIVERSYLDLLKPLDYIQCAPIGFLWIERFFCQIIGSNEYGLRFFPLLCGLIAVFLFYHLAHKVLTLQGTVIAVIFFACTQSLIYYSAEVKQYSAEVMVGLVLIALAIRTLSHPANFGNYAAIAIAGIIGLSLSFSSFILLAGIAATWFIVGIHNRKIKEILMSCGVSVLWMLVFLVYYYVIIRHYPISQQVSNFSQQLRVFWPIPPHSISEFLWPLRMLADIIDNPLGMKFAIPILFCMVFGAWNLWKRNPIYSLLICACLAIALALSAMRKYPFGYRMILYLVPFLLIWLSEGLDALRKRLELNHAGIYLVILAFFIYVPIFRTISVVIKPMQYEEIKPAMEHIDRNTQAKDVIYVYYKAWPAFEFYQKKYPFLGGLDVIMIPPQDYNRQTISDTMPQLQKYNRVWVLFTHCAEEKVCLRQFTQYVMDLHFKSLSVYEEDGAWLYLYDIHPDAGQPPF
jgi:hypothetical protein